MVFGSGGVMDKKSNFLFCGLCKESFDSKEEVEAHFKSKQHLESLTGPRLVEAIKESQIGIVKRIAGNLGLADDETGE